MKSPYVCIPLQSVQGSEHELHTVLLAKLTAEFYSGERFTCGNDLLRRVLAAGTTPFLTQLINWSLQHPLRVRLAYRVYNNQVLFWFQSSRAPTKCVKKNAELFKEFITETAPDEVAQNLVPLVKVCSLNHSKPLLGMAADDLTLIV